MYVEESQMQEISY
jgi:hypothetical protein